MRIGMVLDAPFPPDPRVENEAISLVQAGHQVFLFCLHYGTQPVSEKHRGIHLKRALSNSLEYKLSALAYTFPFYSWCLRKKIRHFIQENEVQVLHVHDLQIAAAAFSANKSFQLPVVLDLHENRPEIMKHYDHLSRFPGNFLIRPSRWKKMEEKFVVKASRVLVVTEEAKKELLSRCAKLPSSVTVIPNTVRRSFSEEAFTEPSLLQKYKDNFVLLYLGDTGLRRGLKTAIFALPKLIDELPTIKLVVVGKSSADKELKRLVFDLKLTHFVDFEGWREVSLFPSYIKASEVCISPLHRNPHHDTTYANKLFQYMSFGKPVLVSDATAQKRLIENVGAGLVHREQDPVDFAEKVRSMAQDKERSQTMGLLGKAFVENEFSWEQTSKNLVHLYDNLNP